MAPDMSRMKDRVWSSTRSLGNRVSHVGRSGANTFRGLKSGASSIGHSTRGAFASSYKAFFWVALIIHLVDAIWMGFDRPTGGYATVVAMYFILSIWAWFLFEHHGFMRSVGSLVWYVLISLFCVFAPLSRALFPSANPVFLGLSIPEMLHFVLLIIPVWAVYVGTAFNYGAMKPIRFIWFFLIVGLMIYAIFSSSFLVGLPGAEESTAPIGKVADKIAQGLRGFWEGLVGIPGQVITDIKNKTLPDYTAQVDRNAQGQLGVYIENLDTTQKTYYYEQPVDAFATIIARSFEGETAVKNSCTLEANHRIIKGDMRGYERFTLAPGEMRQMVCSFDASLYDENHVNVTRDTTVRVFFQSRFTFETWGYVTYSFIDRNLSLNLRNQKKDIHQLYGLDPYPEAVYTDGPIKLGLVDPHHPLELPYSVYRAQPLLPLFGIKIDNKDRFGRIINITELNFTIPAPLEIDRDRCIPRNTITQHVFADDAHTYSIEKPITYARDQTAIVIQCPLQLDPGDVDEFLGSGGVSINTFAVKARYDYELVRPALPITLEGPRI